MSETVETAKTEDVVETVESEVVEQTEVAEQTEVKAELEADTKETPLTSGSAPRVSPATYGVLTSFTINKLVRVSPLPVKVTGLQFT